MDKKSSEELAVKACEILKSHNIEPVRHFSPYDEAGGYVSGSAFHRFWDINGRMYSFLFEDGELVWSSGLLEK